MRLIVVYPSPSLLVQFCLALAASCIAHELAASLAPPYKINFKTIIFREFLNKNCWIIESLRLFRSSNRPFTPWEFSGFTSLTNDRNRKKIRSYKHKHILHIYRNWLLIRWLTSRSFAFKVFCLTLLGLSTSITASAPFFFTWYYILSKDELSNNENRWGRITCRIFTHISIIFGFFFRFLFWLVFDIFFVFRFFLIMSLKGQWFTPTHTSTKVSKM